jgi:hypothetical protein
MKKKFLIFCVFATAALLFQTCDYVRNANPPPKASTTGSTTSPGIVYRKVLVEDYTGHKCGNCPAAGRELKRLDSVYSGKIVPIAIHAGFYANVTPGSTPPYPTDFKTTSGTDYDNAFGNSAAGNPNGLVNRVSFGLASFIKQWSSWETSVATMDTIKADFKIEIANSYNIVSNQLTTTVTATALNYKTTANYNLVVLLTEDSIVAEQIDYSLPAGQQYVSNYTFNHVLRTAINSSWGDPLFTGAVSTNDVKTKTYTNFQLSSAWKYKHCHVIAFLYDANTSSATYYEIFQVEMKDVN